MVNLTQQTKSVKKKQIIRYWHLIDVKEKILGRVIGRIALLLIGKHKTNYVPYLDCGDYVVIVNAKDVRLSGKKENEKIYTRYSGYPGGLKKICYKRLLSEKPTEIIRHAVLGVLPKNKLRKRRISRLYVFADEKHPFADKLKNLDKKNL